MSRRAYSAEERDRIRSELMEGAEALFREKGVLSTGVEEIYGPLGISKTFFYAFYPSKAHLALSILEREMAKLGEAFRSNVWSYGAENGIRETFREVLSGKYFVPGPDDQAFLAEQLDEDELMRLRGDVVVLFSDMLYAVGVPTSSLDPRVLCNLVVSILAARADAGGRLLLVYPEAAEEATSLQVDALVSLVLGRRVI